MRKMQSILSVVGMMLTNIMPIPIVSAELPPGRKVTINNEISMCYDLEGYKGLLHVDNELLFLRDKTGNLEISNNLKDQTIVHYKDIVKTQQDTIKVISEDHQRMFMLWADENYKRHEAENKPSFNGWAWTLAGVFAATTGVLLIERAVE